MRRVLGMMMIAGVSAGLAAAQSPAPAPKAKRALEASPVPIPPPPATADSAAPAPVPKPARRWNFEMELADVEAAIAGIEGGIAGGISDGIEGGIEGLRMSLEALPALAPMPPLPPLPPMSQAPELADMAEKFAPLARLGNEFAMLAQAVQPPQPPQAPQPAGKPDSRADEYYRRGTESLDRRQWDRAIDAFDQVIDRKGTRADGAHYWKAYALNRLGRRSESLAVIDALRKNHPGSRWLNDAAALEVELKQASGRPVSPDSVDDEDIKLIAINSLMNSDPERAVPLLERTLQQSNSPKLKERSLFVLANAGTPRAREVVAKIAKGGGNPDLQIKAVEYLGIHRGTENAPLLAEVYQGTQDVAVKKAVLRAFMVGRQKERLLAAAKSEGTPELRREAIHLLGVSGGQAELEQLFNGESDPELRRSMVRAFMVGGNFNKLADIARNDKDATVRREAIRHLGHMDRGKASEVLIGLYGNEADRNIRQEIARGLFHQENAKALIEVARKENDLQVKRDIVRMLSNMDTKEARDFLAELLK